ncbi:hypothetical protein NQZ68_032298 [Dissostichus eleginoides]|nr:hypothetical protein NQZ68_032298 [Dissostichus eleginoides]
MADKGPFLTSCIIFYLSIGAAIFQILEEPNWKTARDEYIEQKKIILKKYTCLTAESLDEILEIVSDAAGQGVTITGDKQRNTWDWGNSVIFAATIVTTIGYGNVAPKTQGGRVFCILYGLCGIPCKKVQFTCTALFLLWGLVVHLVIPPFVFMSIEGWSYLEGLYFSFITLTTVGFGDYVAGVNPNIEYPRLYRVFAELWIYMGLAWLSLFFSWNVHMVVKAHKVFKKRRHRHRHFYDLEPEPVEEKHNPELKRSVIDIFNFLSEEEEDYSTVIKGIGTTANKTLPAYNINRSKSCSDILANNIQTLDHSPRHRRMLSISEVFINAIAVVDKSKHKARPLIQDGNRETEPAQCVSADKEEESCALESNGIFFTVPSTNTKEEEIVQHPHGGGTRFTIAKVVEENEVMDKDEKG